MALFGKKKRSFDEIMQDVESLSEEEKNELLSRLQSKPVEEAASAETENVETAENNPPETAEQGEEPQAAEQTEDAEATETAEPVAEAVETTEETETAAEEAPTEPPAEETVETTSDAPLETPQPEEQTGTNYDELIAAQNARFDSLESQIAALKETVEKVVANQDNKNFGYSPKANFDDVQTSRRDAILQGYAPRRADQYK